ncbi:MAG TPA: group 1 truncated hemoglobin [Polyangia bacterium]
MTARKETRSGGWDRRRLGAIGIAVGSVLALGAGCDSKSSTTGAGGAGGIAGGAGGAGGAVTLYLKYGGAPTVAKVVDDAVTGLLADCEEAPYFSVVGTTGHDSVARLKSCLRLQFTVLMGGPGVYPGVNDEGDTCASMTAIHAGLGIPSDVFDKFVADLGAVLAADGVSAADVTTIAGAVAPLKAQIVQTPAKLYDACGGAGGTSGAGGAGGTSGAGGATTSLYLKYGGAPTVTKVVDDAVTGLLADCEEAPYFSVVGTTGHDSVARLKSCLRLQFTVLMGGPGVYPGVNDEGDTCASMTAIHANLGITGPVFDKFVSDLGAVLTADGVSSADVTTIAGAVSPLKTEVVQTPAKIYNACGGAGGSP